MKRNTAGAETTCYSVGYWYGNRCQTSTWPKMEIFNYAVYQQSIENQQTHFMPIPRITQC